jgi:hypothetical protein
MLIDWNNPPSLPCPKRPDLWDRERLGWAKRRRVKHKPSKAHATGKRTYAIGKARKARHGTEKVMREAERQAYVEAALAYWRGERDGHP